MVHVFQFFAPKYKVKERKNLYDKNTNKNIINFNCLAMIDKYFQLIPIYAVLFIYVSNTNPSISHFTKKKQNYGKDKK